ncbi:MAG: recombinase family protein [Anaerolineales bacterium]
MRAAIYIRVSSERQSEGASPDAQEQDGREYCKSKGYSVVKVYRDTERYRVGKRLVEPSGTRADRPGFRAMISDARKDIFDIIIAWRADRLYRGSRALYDIAILFDETNIEIEGVKEHIDKNTIEIQGWAAKQELKAKADRFFMGVAGRLRDKKKPWCSVPPYGYKYVNKELVINNLEAKWVKKIYDWRIDGKSLSDIRHKLITGGAPQRKAAKIPWAIAEIRKKLLYEPYSTGIMKVNWDGDLYEIPIPQIIDIEKAEAIKEICKKYKAYPCGNMRAKALAPGLVYCAQCNRSMSVLTLHNSGHDYYYYACNMRGNIHEAPPGCAKHNKMGRVDAIIWEKVERFLSEPARMDEAILNRIKYLQAQEIDAKAEVERLLIELDNLTMERQKVISWARREIITEDDLEFQLAALQDTGRELQSELTEKRMLAENNSERLLEVANQFMEQIKDGWELATKEPENHKEAELQFQLRKKIVEVLVSRVDIYEDKSIKVSGEIALQNDLCVSNQPSRW